jgi:hypothetical protein
LSSKSDRIDWDLRLLDEQFFLPPYLRRIVGDFLTDRAVVYPSRTGYDRREVTCGVPQGSMLGPFLWNIGYDWVLRGALPEGVAVTCYADDTLVTARGGTQHAANLRATAGVAQVVRRIRQLGLEVALHNPRHSVSTGLGMGHRQDPAS